MSQTLRGGCSCGRNKCFINIPLDASDQAEVYFDSSSVNRRTQAAPLTAWLRVPLEWYQSSTVSFFPDETHSAIRRTFIPPDDPHCRRVFCGFCGTPLTYWTESPPEEADYMSITVGSLFGQDQSALEDLGLLPEDVDAGTQLAPATSSRSVTPAASSSRQVASAEPQVFVTRQSGTLGGIPWFEEMIEGSRLGRVGKHRRGVGGNDTMHVEWEVTEWHDTVPSISTETSETTGSPRISAKRKSPQKTPERQLKVFQTREHALALESLILLPDPVFFNPWPLEFSFVSFPPIVMEFSFRHQISSAIIGILYITQLIILDIFEIRLRTLAQVWIVGP